MPAASLPARPFLRLARALPAAFARSLFGSPDIVALALRRAARRKGFVVGRTLYAVVILAIIMTIVAVPRADPNDLPQVGRHLFLVLAISQGLLALFVPPVLLAQTVARERRDGTAELLLLTHGDPSHVIRGLVTSRLLLLFVVFLGGAPVASIAALLGGISFVDITYVMLGCFLCSFFGAALGAFLGADVSPKLAPYLALVGSLVCLWLFQYPLIMLGMVMAALVSSGAPHVVVAAGLGAIVLPVLFIAHRLMTREAGRSLVRRLGQSVVPAAPPATRASSRIPRKSRHAELESVFAPPLARLAPSTLALAIPLALTISLLAAAIPGTFPVLEAVRTILVVLIALGGFSLLGLLLLAVTFYPAMQIATLLSDATLVLVALAPIDPSKTLARLERHALAIGGIALTVSAILVGPLLLQSDGSISTASALLSLATTAILVGFAAAVSLYVGTKLRSVTRALGVMAGIAVATLVSMLILAPWGIWDWHPLATPIALLTNPSYDASSRVVPTLLLIPASFLLHMVTRRQLARTFREPFEELTPEFAHFG